MITLKHLLILSFFTNWTLSQDAHNITIPQGVIIAQQAPTPNIITGMVTRRPVKPIDPLKYNYPQCPAECAYDDIGDGWCSEPCHSETCGNDGGDCDGWCASECRPTWPGDGECDRSCFREECEWDKGDCDKILTKGVHDWPILSQKKELPDCTCDKTRLGNGVCDNECNTKECLWDLGDCREECSKGCSMAWLGDGQCDTECAVSECSMDKGDCPFCNEGCRADMVGNGICDSVCMNDDCHWDIGDCAGTCFAHPVNYTNSPFEYAACREDWIGDGECDCSCLNEACTFDGGDCEEGECDQFLDHWKSITGHAYP